MPRRTRRPMPALALMSATLIAPAVMTTAAGAAPSHPAISRVTSASKAPAVRDDGPHSPIGRVPAPTAVTTKAGVSVSRYDLGDVDLGGASNPHAFRAPLRGSLVTPAAGTANGPTKLVIISHLRSAGCANEVFAFPCPGGEVRLDRGMEYLGEALAKQGYTVLIPDVAPVWIGTTLATPYDQVAGWIKVVGTTRDALGSDVAGRTSRFGVPLKGRVDMSGAGLLVHSRSGLIAGPAAQAWKNSATPLRSVLAYGPAYDVPDVNGHISTPVPADLPYLGLVGDADHDVPFNANLWLAENVEQKRSAMAAVATVPGLGHNFINRALSTRHIDDRLDCGSSCPGATAHEAFLTSVATQFFDSTLRGRASAAVPSASDAVLPSTLGGLPARWLAVTNSAHRVSLLDADASRLPAVSTGSKVSRCRFYDPQDPTHHADRCADPNRGSVWMISHAVRATLRAGGSVGVATNLRGATSIDVHVTPYGDRADGGPDSPLQVAVTTASGKRITLPMPANARSVTQNRTSADSDGNYPLATLRVAVPASLRAETITSVQIVAPRGGDYAVRAIDATAAATGPAGSSTSPSNPSAPKPPTSKPSTSKPSTSKPSAPGSSTRPATTPVGPLVQTDLVTRR